MKTLCEIGKLSSRQKSETVRVLEKRFHVRLTDRELQSAATFADLVCLFTAKIPRAFKQPDERE